MNLLRLPAFLLLAFTLTAAFIFSPVQIVSGQPANEAELALGSIDFPTSADGEAQREFLTGVLALHSFWYPEARGHFQQARKADPDFAMAYWGEALTYDHPVWGQHDQQAGLEVLEAMDRRSSLEWDEREKKYIAAVRQLFDPEASMDERRINYAEAMKSLSERYPEDDEALAFSALSEMTVPSHSYNNPDVRDVVPIAAKLEGLYQRNPEHPGAMHYLIHLYDNDKFAELGLRPADDYADVAYSSSHAIHMPSHIYKQLGLWENVIQANIDAWEASVEWQQETGRPLAERDYHSYSWLFDGYLETGRFGNACEMIETLRSLVDKAESKGQDTGRIERTLERFREQYESEAGASAPSCEQ